MDNSNEQNREFNEVLSYLKELCEATQTLSRKHCYRLPLCHEHAMNIAYSAKERPTSTPASQPACAPGCYGHENPEWCRGCDDAPDHDASAPAQPTPGPWFDWVEYRKQHGRSVVAYRDENDAIVSVLNCEQQEANARFIAAVPDLLAALQLVKEDIEGFLSGEWDGNADGWRCTLAGINAVLALPDVEAAAPDDCPDDYETNLRHVSIR